MYLSEHPVLSVALNNTNINSVINILGGGQAAGQLNAVPIILSGCLLFLLPLIIFYIVIQRRFMASIATSGIVG
jgi:ABC-type glycerol-3-phosphate transport system permease component